MADMKRDENTDYEYVDGEYVEAANELSHRLTALLDALWETGASVNNVEDLLEEAFENCTSSLSKVQISLTIRRD